MHVAKPTRPLLTMSSDGELERIAKDNFGQACDLRFSLSAANPVLSNDLVHSSDDPTLPTISGKEDADIANPADSWTIRPAQSLANGDRE